MKRMVVLCVLTAALAGVGPAVAGRGGKVPGFPNLPGTWSHAEINVTIGRTPHTLILDRGVLARVSRSGLQLHESDGSTRSMPVSGRTMVADATGRLPFRYLRAGLTVETMRIDGGVAVRIRIL